MAKKWGFYVDLTSVTKRLEALGGNIDNVVDEALRKTHEIVTDKVEQAWRPHNRSGKTERSLVVQPKVEWDRGKATVKVGFDLAHGGMPSVWVMGGTKVFGTPRIKPDNKLRNAFYGKDTEAEVKAAQEEIFYSAIRKLEGS